MQKIETGISELLKRQPVTEQEKDAYIQDLQKALRLLLEEVRDLEEMVALLQKKRFGSSSETPVQEEEEPLGVFPEAELEYKEDAPEPFKKDQRGVHKISEAGRWKLTSSNETENRIFDLDEEERICPRCKGKLVWIGKELVREVFEYQRPKLKLVRYWQMSYKCPACHKKGRSVIVRASVPKPLLNHSLVAASVVAEIMYQKYVNAMPLYRQEAAWKQLGVTFSRTTMARWIIRCAEDWLEPLWNAMRKELLQREVLHADETVVQVLKENGKTAQSKSYMWVYRTGMDGLPPIVLYDYQPGRSGGGSMDTCIPTAMPATTRCRILPAAAAGPICAGSSWRPCLLHPATPKVCSHRHRLAGITVTSCLQLKRNWLDCQPKKDRNARKQQPYMENYLLDPRCQISNNLAENAIRPFTVGRKNWLFSDTVKGAKASAVIYSLVETAGANGLSERGYLHIVLSNLPSMDFRQHPELLKDLMPWSDYMRSCFEQE